MKYCYRLIGQTDGAPRLAKTANPPSDDIEAHRALIRYIHKNIAPSPDSHMVRRRSNDAGPPTRTGFDLTVRRNRLHLLPGRAAQARRSGQPPERR
jgi:hypothetical protein